MRSRGKLIVLEGIDGGGKTTLARGIAKALEARGHRVITTKEPTDGPIGKRIRALASTGRDAVTAEEEFQLFHADRTDHVNQLIRPALESGAIVVQDRSYFSTIAYQGERGLDRDRLRRLSEEIAPKPDVLFVVDVPAELAIERIKVSRNATTDDFEKIESLKRVRQVFLSLPDAVVLDGRRSPDALLDEAIAVITRHVT